MTHDAHPNEEYQLESLLTVERPTIRGPSPAASANPSVTSNSTAGGRFVSSSEHLLGSRRSSGNIQSQGFSIRQSRLEQSGNVDLEASYRTVSNQDLRDERKKISTTICLQFAKVLNFDFIRILTLSAFYYASTTLKTTSRRIIGTDDAVYQTRSDRLCEPYHAISSIVVATSARLPYYPINVLGSRQRLDRASHARWHQLVQTIRRIMNSPWTKVSIFLLILLQMTILAFKDLPLYYDGISPLDFIYLGIFFLYTVEVICRGISYCFGRVDSTSFTLSWPFNSFFASLDLIAVIAFWIMFILTLSGVPWSQFRQVFAMLSALRILRLLRVTHATDLETTVIFAALKESGVKLGKVAYFICFFWLLFAVVGVQSFKSSLKRSCVFPATNTTTLKNPFYEEVQFCGGHIVSSSNQGVTIHTWLLSNGKPVALGHRGYLCPHGLVCQERNNPYNGTVSFDNIFQSLELVFVTFSANTFSNLMYNVMDSEGLIAALFFVAVIAILYFWLVILLIGIVTGSLQATRSKHQSQTTAEEQGSVKIHPVMENTNHSYMEHRIREMFKKTKWFWILIITHNLVAQCLQTSQISTYRKAYIGYSEAAVTWTLLFEIVLRFIIDWRTFHQSKRNLTDLGLALITSAMQSPSFQKAGRVYTWFTAFQIARCYRLFWAITPVRDIMMLSFSCFPALVQLCSFLFLLVFLASVLATQVFKIVDVSAEEPFTDLWKSFLAMYQIFTGEDWTRYLYTVTARVSEQRIAWIAAIFIISWFILSSLIILNMFLSRIDESMNLPDDRRRFSQVKTFLYAKHKVAVQNSAAEYPKTQTPMDTIGHDNSSGTEEHTLTMIETFLQNEEHCKEATQTLASAHLSRETHWLEAWATMLTTKLRKFWSTSGCKRHSKPLWFSQLQKKCRILVIPTGHILGASFRIFIYMSVITQVVLTCVTIPLYQRQYIQEHSFSIKNWFLWTDLGFALLWTVEGLMKIIAGGCISGEHAYFRGWNLIDAIVTITSWMGILASLYNIGHSPFTALVYSFKALRVLRLLTINKTVMKEVTFVFRRGSYKIFASILVSLSLLVPFAIFGTHLFMGRAMYCNDPKTSNLLDCLSEFVPSTNGGLLAPRAVVRPYYSFDSFGQSFYTLFLIVSQEGWTDVMYWARGVSSDSSSYGSSNTTSNMNSLFFVVFNFCGTIFVISLFAAVMIQNYTEATGVAYLTGNQRAWMEQHRLLRRVQPSRRPVALKNINTWRGWCYNRATKEDGKWRKSVISMFVLYMLLLCIEFYPIKEHWKTIRDNMMLLLMVLLFVNMITRLFGLSLRFFFKRPWDWLSLIFIPAGLATSVVHIVIPHNTTNNYISRIVQPFVALLVIPYIRTFRHLFNTALASIPLVSTLLITWFVLLLFFAIGLTQAFGLTRFGPNETGNVNFRTVPKALILLFRMTLGEGRTKIMEDFATIVPPFCTVGEKYFESDCGDAVLARGFFIAWKVLSTYLFTSLFISLVFDSFSYVYQDFNLKTGTISQDDIRRFKDAWALVDPRATGHITPILLPRFTSLISGKLSMSVYENTYSITYLRKACEQTWPLASGAIDIVKLNIQLASMPTREVRERRRVMDQYRMELLMTQDSVLGISMQTALITLFYYKLLDHRDYLKFEIFLERSKRLREVDEALRMESLAGLIKTYRCRRAFLRIRESTTGVETRK